MSQVNHALIQTLCAHAQEMFSNAVTAESAGVCSAMETRAKATPEPDKRALRAAANLLQSGASELGADVAAKLRVAFNAKINRIIDGPQKGKGSRISLDELSLVDDFEMQETIALSKLEKRLKEEAEYEHYALARRLETLLLVDAVVDADNPFYTGVFCRALMDGLGAIGLVQHGKLAAFASFESALMNLMPQIYVAMNGLLVDVGILVEVPAPHESRIKRTASHPGFNSVVSGTQISTPEVADQVGHSVPTGPGDIRSVPTLDLALYPALARLLGLVGADASVARADAVAEKPLSATLMAELRKMQMLAVPMPGIIDLGMTMPIPVTYTDDGVPVLQPTAIDSVLRKLAAEMRPSDVAATRFVRALFVEIFSFEDAPWNIKELLSQMQIPVLRLGLLDPTIFAENNHPIWRFMDRIADMGVKYGATLVPGTAQYEHLATIMQYVVTQFDDDIGLFHAAVKHLDISIGVDHDLAEEAFEEAIGQAEFDEKRAIGIAIGEYEVRRRISGLNYPAGTTQFLLLFWGRLLAKDFLEHGENSSPWKQDIGTLDDIVLCTQSAARGDRDSLRDRLPMLLGRFNAGMDRMRVPSAERGAFVQEMVDYHTELIRFVRGESSRPLDLPVFDAVHDLPDPRLPATTPAATIGQWFILRNAQGESSRHRMVWISPRGSTYLLKNYDTGKLVTLSESDWRTGRQRADITDWEDVSIIAPSLAHVLEREP